MGLTHLDVKISNPAKLEKSWQGKFLVDTEAIDSLVPRNQLEAIDLKPEGQRTYELANGKLIRMDIAIGKLEVLGEISGATNFWRTRYRAYFRSDCASRSIDPCKL